MKTCPYLLSRTAFAVFVTTAFTLNTEIVLAEQATDTPVKEVVVEAKTALHTSSKKLDFAGRAEETLTLQRHVSYSDLDLGRPGDVLMLKQRIKTNARQACEDLDKLSPLTRLEEDGDGCVQRAIKSANDGLKMAIASARK